MGHGSNAGLICVVHTQAHTHRNLFKSLKEFKTIRCSLKTVRVEGRPPGYIKSK